MDGTYFHNIDAKGRMNFPAKLREELGETFWLVRGTTDKFLSVYSVERWKKICDQVAQQPGPEGESLRRWLHAGACEVVPDKQGRILVPQNLRIFAGLEKDVVVIGAGTRSEIWDKDRWAAVDEAFDPKAGSVLATLCM